MAAPYNPLTNGIPTNGHLSDNQDGSSTAGPSKTTHHTLFPSPPTSPPIEVSGLTPPSFGENGQLGSTSREHESTIVTHLYQTGFQLGNYSDISLDVHNRRYRLHALILSRSPYLAHLISTQRTDLVYVPLEEEPHITEEGFAVALGYLYSSVSLQLVAQNNARSVLASASLLGGMTDLCEYAYEVCKASISVETLNEWLQFIDSISPSPDGTTRPSVFGPYAERLRTDVFRFLVIILPTVLHAFQSPADAPSPQPNANGHHATVEASGKDALQQIYSRLPFDFFKHAVESPEFAIGSVQARFQFAKSVIAMRKKGFGRDAEETVVLAFGGVGDSGSAVHITRKLKKRSLWKVTK